MYYNEFPLYEIDHIDGDGLNNRIPNLRDVSSSINSKNRKLSSNNSSGHIGITWEKQHNTWRVRVSSCGKRNHIGRYSNLEDAVNAHNIALLLDGEYTERHGK